MRPMLANDWLERHARHCLNDCISRFMSSSFVQFANVQKHYQMGLVTVEALRGVNVLTCVFAGRTRIAPRHSKQAEPSSAVGGWKSRQRLECVRLTAAFRRASPRKHRDWQASREFPNAETRKPQRFAEETFLRVSPRSLRLCVKQDFPSPGAQSGAQAYALQTLARPSSVLSKRTLPCTRCSIEQRPPSAVNTPRSAFQVTAVR
jgi:hypothetical protein